MELKERYERAAEAIRRASVLVITAGAGMGVDSGLPDFRGDDGFWTAYPMYQKLGINFIGAANPAHFERDPAFGWGFYGHRTNLYRQTVPHRGFHLLREWIDRFGAEYFVVTSNVDGQFQKAGYPENRMLEVHGSIHHLQCLKPCRLDIWENREEIPVDLDSMRAFRIPLCPHCGHTARPNILMFSDYSWIGDRSDHQEGLFHNFLERTKGTALTVIELGAGSAIPTIRLLGERLGRTHDATVVRINPREPYISPPHLSLPCGALESLSEIGRRL